MWEWERDLEGIRSDGWSYAYAETVDWDTGRHVWLVEIARHGVMYKVARPTIEEAVEVVYDFVEDSESGINNFH